MGRLCERPGCSEEASVAYGMRAPDLVFWLDTLANSDEQLGGVLCRRHADSMVVPRNWTLDDLRDPHLHLFRPPTIERRPRSPRRRAGGPTSSAEQLSLEVDASGIDESDTEPSGAVAVAPGDVEIAVAGDVEPVGEAVPSDATVTASSPGAAPWRPDFDPTDDLDGVLSARSPLLARAFRGDDRPR